jgi:very-short-patch-repair endonuclease
LHRIDGVRRGHVVVIVRHSGYERFDGITVHQLNDLLDHHVTQVDGLPVTTPVRTLVDLAAVINPLRLRDAIESVIVQRLGTFSEIDRVRRDVSRRGKPGMRKLVAVLDRIGGEPPAESIMERWLLEAAAIAGVPVTRQADLPWQREPIRGLTDATTIGSKVIFEADSRRWHARYQAMAKDRRRDREAAKAGYLTLRFVYEDLLNDLPGVAADMAEIHAQRQGLANTRSDPVALTSTNAPDSSARQ